MRAVSLQCADSRIPAFFEPTSVPKSVRLFDFPETVLSGAIRYASPNALELVAMSTRAAEEGLEKFILELGNGAFEQWNERVWEASVGSE